MPYHQALKRIFLALAVAAPVVTPAHAGTNFPGVNDYPLPTCAKPGPAPVMQSDDGASRRRFNTLINNHASEQDAVQEYNDRLARYNAAQLAYHACINAYLANAQLDLNMVRSKAGKQVPNLPALKDYPAPDCGDRVAVPRAENDTTTNSLTSRIDDYNAGMARYNKYIACMNTYIANVQSDINVIQAQVNKAIADSSP